MTKRILLCVGLCAIQFVSAQKVSSYATHIHSYRHNPIALYYQIVLANPSNDTIEMHDSLIVQKPIFVICNDGTIADYETPAISGRYIVYKGDTIYATAFLNPDYRYKEDNKHYQILPNGKMEYHMLICRHQLMRLWQTKYLWMSEAKFFRSVARNATIHISTDKGELVLKSRKTIRHKCKWLERESLI